MEKLILKDNSVSESNVLAIIDQVWKAEKSNNLTDNEIIKKYTTSECLCLSSLIKKTLPDISSFLFFINEEYFHYAVGIIKSKDDLKNNLNNISFYDINGRKNFDDMCKYLINLFQVDNPSIIIKITNISYLSNDVTDKVYHSIKFQPVSTFE